ncbi:carboxypeptidase M32 [Fodinisporobacter ferrooxydans]|uniref:Metal-dependent carboxypeptidase n=1 Tax=Fodinisporobacter ferrooxydans TaxID=2901836 RepID=A0ABY4CMH9_9BACL|nr:carboxypeptidase M32 [Alicyclobacillaceae bacterium MYW30-H2]
MARDFQGTLQSFQQYLRKMQDISDASSVLYWDARTGMPKKGVDRRSQVIATLSAEAFRMSISDEMGNYIAYFLEPENNEKLDDIMRAVLAECKKEYDRSRKIPADTFEEYVRLTAKAESVWEDAKDTADFSMFRPYLEQIVQMNAEFIEYWGYTGNKYDTLLEYYEPGMTVEKLDRIFGDLRKELVSLLQRVKESPHKPRTKIFEQYFDPAKQREFSIYILKKMGYDFHAGRIDETVHPFEISFGPGDVRITTKYLPNDFRSALFSSMHEGGHALYEQNISERLIGTILCSGTSMGIHESQSRFWENIVGRSKTFWSHFLKAAIEHFPEQFRGVTLEEFYRGINEARESLIRIEADELTYNLHIMIRYEIEKALFNGDLQVKDLPLAWAEKMREYLGVEPQHDGEGCLQDVHWSGGSFGYFPSYALGNIYSAQFLHAMKKEMPAYDSYVADGRLIPIKDWLAGNIYQYGKMQTPEEILRRVAGEEVNGKYLVDYLTAKYTDVYQL